MRTVEKIVIAVVSTAAIGVALAWAWTHLGPDSLLVGPWTSDAAVPVLMSNADQVTLFHLYYLAQDRFGALPYILAAWFRAGTGFAWTPERLAHFQQLAIFASIPAVALLLRPRWMWAVIWAAVLVLLPWRFHLFDLCQPYGWQLTAFFYAWWGMRRAREDASLSWFIVASMLAFVACWISAFSAPLLLCVAIAEALAERWSRLTLLPFGVAVVGAGLEGIVRGVYQVYSKRNFGTSFRTTMQLQFSGAGEALRESFERLGELGPIVLVAFAVLMIAAVVALVIAVRKLLARQSLDENTVTLLGLAAIALATAVVPSLISHFRENGLQQKYFTVTAFSAVLGALIAVERVAVMALPRLRERVWYAGWALACLAAMAVHFVAPEVTTNPDYGRYRRVARELARRAPDSFIVSGYWDTFSLAALAIPERLRPYSYDGQYERTPYLRDELRMAEHVWLGQGGFSGVGPPEATEVLPIAGSLLERTGEPVEFEGLSFIPYRSAMDREVDVGLAGREVLRGCPEQVAFIAPELAATLYVVETPPARARLTLNGAEVEPRAIGERVSAWRLEPGAEAVLLLARRDEGRRCPFSRLFVLADRR